MKLSFQFSFAVLLLSLFAFSCSKEETKPVDIVVPAEFKILTATATQIPVGSTTEITADAIGTNLSFGWSLKSGSRGDILGSGNKVLYGASTCCTGANVIECTVSDGTNSFTKEITITVK